jgi:TPR repeat protein
MVSGRQLGAHIDRLKAILLFEIAARHFKEALSTLGISSLTATTYRHYFTLIQLAADRGCDLAQYSLGCYYDKNYEKALECYQKATIKKGICLQVAS